MDLPYVKLDNPNLQNFTIKTSQLVEEMVPTEKEFTIDGNIVKGYVYTPIKVPKVVDTVVDIMADHIGNYEVSYEPQSLRLTVRYFYGFFNNGTFQASTKNDSIVFNGAGYRAAGFGSSVTPTDIINAVMKYQKISGTIVF